MTPSSTPTITRVLDLLDQESEALLAALAPDAVVTDDGSTYRGHDEIRAWHEGVLDGPCHARTLLRAETDGEHHVTARCHLEGDFAGSPVELVFEVATRPDGLVERLDIHP